ncbi:MAG: hypothetical protein A3F67_04395 [Verrucomicrobia bacterium RIFCSPHIGHO2_12_FULL_41_10]|nr:MAG: hypothetical protein A3F67_04395 [Verrucomicrobia bacterium RIFCSPHIGHO2_12_FULL_41_10]HLB33004.1 Xaa-Pro peptidase family protein [Chthoniobacterales bacterium]
MTSDLQPSTFRNTPTRLIISESERGADMFYATGFRAPDDFVFVEHRGKKSILLSDLEVDRGRREAKVDAVVSFSELEKSLEKKLQRKPNYAETVAAFVKKQGSSKVFVPSYFPLGIARALEKNGLTLKASEGNFFPEREIKRPEEVRHLQQALRTTEAGMTRALEILGKTTIEKNHQLKWDGAPLTSERLRREVEGAILQAGGIPAGDSIIACGMETCDPHERGHGVLKGHQLIIIDLFPREARSGFYGDMTRTVVRGKASEAQQHLWNTCLKGQKLALRALKPGASGATIHQAVQDFFTTEGYPTEQKEGRWSGFFHGTGHGLGLDIHEEPRFGKAILKPGNVFTIEPGIYIPGLGGVRLEDVVVITVSGYRMLSKFPKQLEI